MKTSDKITWATVIAYGEQASEWACGRCINNRGTMFVWKFRGRLWRPDRRRQTSVAELQADGWHRVKAQLFRR